MFICLINLPLDVVISLQEDSTSIPPSSQEDSTSIPPFLQETEMFVDPDHPSKVLEGLNRLRLNGTLCDVILCCEEQEFPCHRGVLASFSSYFEVKPHIY